MNKLIYILLLFALPIYGQYSVNTNNGTSVRAGAVITAQDDDIPPPSGGSPSPPGPDYTITTYILEDFDNAPYGLYDSADIATGFPGVTWADSYKTDSHDSLRVVDFGGRKCLLVMYFEGNVGTYPDWTSSTPSYFVDGSGERFVMVIWDSIAAAQRDEDLWWSWNGYIAAGFEGEKGGKTGIHIRAGEEHGLGAYAPDSSEGASLIMMWDWNEVDGPDFNGMSSYTYHQIPPYDGGGYAQVYWWDGIDSDLTDTIKLPIGQWFNVTVHAQMNSFSGGQANEDGFIEAWLNGVMKHRKSGIMFLHDYGYYTSLVYPGWYDMEFATFFGGGSNSHRSTRDEKFYYDDIRVFEVTGDDFPTGDTVDRSIILDWPWMPD